MENPYTAQDTNYQTRNTAQKIAQYRNDMWKKQHRAMLHNRRMMQMAKVNGKTTFKQNLSHLDQNPAKEKLIPLMREWMTKPVVLEKLIEYTDAIEDKDIFQQHFGIISLRRLLCESKNEKVVNQFGSRTILRIITMTGFQHQKHIQLEATWCLANMVAGTTEQTNFLIQNNIINVFINLCTNEYKQIVEQAVWGLGNISGDCVEFRTLILKSNAHETIINVYNRFYNDSAIVSYIAWVFLNICRTRREREAYCPKIQAIIKVLIDIFIRFNDNEILCDCLSGLRKYAKRDYISSFANMEFLAKLKQYYMNLFQKWNENVGLLSGVHSILGIVTSSEDENTDMIIKTGFLKELARTSSADNVTMLREICFICSNIAIGSEYQISALLSEPGLIDKIFELTYHNDDILSKEALWTICNLSKTRSHQNIKILFENKILDIFKHYLNADTNVKKIMLVLDSILQLINFFDSIKEPGTRNQFINLMIKEELDYKIEDLQVHESEDIYLKCLNILENHFDLVKQV